LLYPIRSKKDLENILISELVNIDDLISSVSNVAILRECAQILCRKLYAPDRHFTISIRIMKEKNGRIEMFKTSFENVY